MQTSRGERVVVLLCCLLQVFGENCRFPIQLPVIDDVSTDQPAVEVAFLSEHAIVSVDAWVKKDGRSKFLTVNEKNPDEGEDDVKLLKNSDKKQVVRFKIRGGFETIDFVSDFDLGCTVISMRLRLEGSRVNESNAVRFDPGRIIAYPQPNELVRTDETYRLRFAVQTEEESALEVKVISLRNESGHYEKLSGFDLDELPMNVTDLASRRKRMESRPELRILLKEAVLAWPAGLKDAILDVVLKKSDFPPDSPIDSMSISYIIDMETKEHTETNFNIKTCAPGFAFPNSIPEQDGIRLLVQAEQIYCVIVTIDGDGVGQVILTEMSAPDTVSRFLPDVHAYEFGKSYSKRTYYMKPLKPGETKDYVLVIQDKEGFLHRKIKVEAYIPLELRLPEEFVNTTAPNKVTLKCVASGYFESLGFYKADDHFALDDRSKWQSLKEFPSSENGGEFEFELITGDKTASKTEEVYFCGAVGRYDKVTRARRYIFDESKRA